MKRRFANIYSVKKITDIWLFEYCIIGEILMTVHISKHDYVKFIPFFIGTELRR
jgi:hypothetical protein